MKQEAEQQKLKQPCDVLKKDVQGNTKLIFHLVKSDRNWKNEKDDNIMIRTYMNTGEILTSPEEINHTWRRYFTPQC